MRRWPELIFALLTCCQTHASAQSALGFAIQNGDISATDLVESAMWNRLAESQSNNADVLRRTKVNLSKVLPRLTSDQQLEVARRVKNFQALPATNTDPMIKNWEKNPAYQQEVGLLGH